MAIALPRFLLDAGGGAGGSLGVEGGHADAAQRDHQ